MRPSYTCKRSSQVSVLLFPRMHNLVTACAQGDEVCFRIVSQLTSWVDVVNLKLAYAPAALAAPPIPL